MIVSSGLTEILDAREDTVLPHFIFILVFGVHPAGRFTDDRIIVRIEMAFEPMAEFKKFTASLLTPTTKSTTASATNATSIKM